LVVGPTTSGVWGNYNSPLLNPLQNAAGHNWIFLAEGLGPSGVTSITSAVVTVFSNQSGSSVSVPTQINYLYPCLDCQPFVSSTTINNVNASDPGSAMYTFTATTYFGPNSWGGFSFVSGPSPTVPATFDTATQKFNWNTVGSPIGSYKWSVQASNPYGTGTGFVTVNITAVPEPASVSLLFISMLTGFGLIRCRRV
jgi:hypothetical protein